MQRAFRWAGLAFGFALIFSGDGCRSKQATNGSIHVTLQTDWYPQPEMGGFYEAQLAGLYKARGLEVTIAPGGPFVVAEQQVATGAADFAMGSSDHVLVSVSHGLPLVAVAATMQEDPQAVMVHEESSVRTFADLEGRTVAVRPGSTWFQYLLKRYDLRNVREVPVTYSVANFLQDPNYIQQVFVTSEPFFARKSGGPVRTLLVNTTGYRPYRVFFTSQAFLREHPEVVRSFVEASLEGWRDYLKDPARTDAEIQRLNPAMTAEQIRFSVETLRDSHFVQGEGTSDSHLGHFEPGRWTTMYQQLRDLGVITKEIDPATAYTTRYAPEAGAGTTSSGAW